MKDVIRYARRGTDYLDKLSDSITTFRAVLYALITYVLAAIALSYYAKIPFTATSIILSTIVLVGVSKISNLILSRSFKVPVNHESDLITGLILALIFTPAINVRGYLILALVALTAMFSKFVLTYNAKHIFNPAALGALTAAVIFHSNASWWVGTSYMTPLLIVGGFLIIRKMRRFIMASAFILMFFIYQMVLEPFIFGGNSSISSHTVYLSLSATPLLFFASIMLTEPLTSPSRARSGIVYAVCVALLYSTRKLHISPEQALLIGNIVSFALEPNRSLLLRLIGRRKEASGVMSYLFASSSKLNYKAGQYLEWTLPGVGVDARGNRRYLTLSSAPSEPHLMFTVKLPPKPSKFKLVLNNMKDGQQIVATRLAGDFVLPDEAHKKLVFIAGGVGITPFRSIIKQLIVEKESRDILLFYFVNHSGDIAFSSLFKVAVKNGVRTQYLTTSGKEKGYLHSYFDEKIINSFIPDYKQRTFYISGSQGFVAAARQTLLSKGISAGNITTDYFPGYN